MWRSLTWLSLLATTVTTASSSNTNSALLSVPFLDSFHKLDHHACVTLFTREGKQGCGTASRESQKGILQLYSGVEGTPFAEKQKEPFVALVKEEHLSKEALEEILSSNSEGYLQGILVTNDTSFVSSDESTSSNAYYSPSSRSPNGKRTPSQFLNTGNSAYGWNANGDTLLQVDFKGIPMAYVKQRDVSLALLEEANTEVVAEFNYYMGPATSSNDELNSETCLSWKDANDDVWRPKCLPLGGNSIWAQVLVDQQAQSANNNRRTNSIEEEQSVGEEEKTRTLEDANNNGGVFFLTASMDANSLFHDSTPAANEAATNILTLLLAAKILGSVQMTQNLDIVVALFQTESFGFVGSRRFLKDISSFTCNSNPVPSVAKNKTSEQACLDPLRPSLEFTKILDPNGDGNLKEIVGMLSVDQVGILTTDQNFYIQSDGSDFGQFLSAVLQAVPANGYTISEAEAAADDDHFDDGEVTIPPTPLTSLISMLGGSGAVLTGYASTFNPTAHYGSHRNSITYQDINYEAIATAATTLARTAVAAAYDGGANLDADTASAYALQVIPDSLSADDETLVELADCLLVHGNCALLQQYMKAEANTESKRTGVTIESSVGLGDPPNYYTGIFNRQNGQPFVTVDGKVYTNYKGDDYGKNSADAFGVQPALVEMAIRGLLNDYLGRPVSAALKSCKKTSDCQNVEYCTEHESICTGGKQCVCRQAHLHLALDEALLASNYSGYFTVSENDEGLSALYTEPYWSNSVGVKVYRDSDGDGSMVAIILGSIVLCASIVATFFMKRTLVKEKLY